MAVIQTIRGKYGKLAGGIIALALVGFIFMDAASGRFGDMFGRDTSVMKVNGNKISQKEYSQRTNEYETLYAMFNNKTLDDATRAQINEQASQLIIFEKVIGDQCDKLGITTNKEEEKDLIYSANPDPLVQQFKIQGTPIFVNQQTGSFDPQYVKAFEQQANQIDPSGKALETWQVVKDYVVRSHRTNVFSGMLVSSVYTPKYLTAQAAKDADKMAGIKYVKIPLATVADNDVKVSDDDLKDYMKRHEALFTADQPVRSIEYVTFDVKPSKEDTDKVLTTLNQLKGDFEKTSDNEGFVNHNSEDQYKDGYVNKKTFMSRFSDTLMNLPAGTVYGPYFENNNYKLTKIVDKKEYPDSVKVRHILVRTKNQNNDVLSDTAAKQRIDSIVAAIKGGARFDSMAAKYSDDDGSKKTGGEYTFTLQQKSGISKEFGDFIFDGKTGENKIVKVSNDNYSGYHYIEILSQNGMQPAVKMATVTKPLYAGDNTNNTAYAAANSFAGKNGTAQAFDNALKTGRLDKKLGDNIKPADYTIQGIGPARDIVKWAYDHKVGEVSQVFSLENKYIVAKLTGAQDKGLMQLNETNRPMIEAAVKAQKKADVIKNKFKSMSTIESIAQAANQQIQNADTVSLGSTYINGLGYEPKVIGYTFYQGFQPNTVSPGIKGQNDVYFISLKSHWQKPTDPSMMGNMLNQQRSMMDMQMKNAMGQLLQQTIIKKANVKFNTGNS